MKCDYYIEKSGKYYCVLKGKTNDGRISYDTYKQFCKYDARKRCPIYQYCYKRG